MNNFCLTSKNGHQFMLHDKGFDFCFKASVCELLENEYLISWLLLARMLVSGTAMHITILPLSHTSFTTACFACPPTHLVGGHNIMKELSLKNHTHCPPPPPGLASPKYGRQQLRHCGRLGCKIRQKENVHMNLP